MNETEKKPDSMTPAQDAVTADEAPADISTVDACIAHAREVKETQLEMIKSKSYDFAPEFRDMSIQLYLFGVMWKCAENLGHAAAEARELAFTALGKMFLQDRMDKRKVPKRIEFLRKMSKLEEDHNALAVAIGYESESGDTSLAELFDHYVDDMQVSGDFWRLYDRGRKIMMYGGLFIIFVVIWFVTIFMPGNSVISVLAAALILAALFVIPVFLVGVVIYRSKMKKFKRAN